MATQIAEKKRFAATNKEKNRQRDNAKKAAGDAVANKEGRNNADSSRECNNK